MRRLSVPFAALALAGSVALAVALVSVVVFFVVGVEDDQTPQAQPSPRTWEWVEWAPPESPDSRPPQLPEALQPRDLAIHELWAIRGSVAAHVIAATVTGHTVRYVLKEESPAHFLMGPSAGMTEFLYAFRFGEKERSMVVQLLDDEGRFAWEARHDGAGRTWVRARPDLAGCGPIFGSEWRRLPSAPGAEDAPPCPSIR